MANPIITGKALRRAREEGVEVPLASSGIWVRLRPVPLDKLLLTGQIPDLLTGVAASVIVEPDGLPNGLANSAEVARKYIELTNLIVPLALVSPRVVENPVQDDECSLEDFSLVERGEILTLSMQPTRVLERFRDKQTANVEPVSDREDNEPTPIILGGNS